ncbi:alcohol dehydrogenase catalytic domain-containing protein [Sphingomonas sp. MMS24-JH45]
MRQLELSHPWGTANLKVVERPDPAPGVGEVVVRMRAASLNFRDTIIAAQGGYARGGEGAPPVVPFSDGCGVVEAVETGVASVAVGDRVATQFFPIGMRAGRRREGGRCARLPRRAGRGARAGAVSGRRRGARARLPDRCGGRPAFPARR